MNLPPTLFSIERKYIKETPYFSDLKDKPMHSVYQIYCREKWSYRKKSIEKIHCLVNIQIQLETVGYFSTITVVEGFSLERIPVHISIQFPPYAILFSTQIFTQTSTPFLHNEIHHFRTYLSKTASLTVESLNKIRTTLKAIELVKLWFTFRDNECNLLKC